MPDAAPSPSTLVRAEANYRDLFRVEARLAPGGRVEERDGLFLAGPGAAMPRYNLAMLTEAPGDPAAVLARAADFFRPLSVRWMLTAVGDAASTIGPVAVAAGMEASSEPGMLLEPLPDASLEASGLRIDVVRDVRTLHVFDETMQAGFEASSPMASDEVLDSGALLNVPGLTFYLAYIDGEPAGTATRYASHRIAGVYDIGVPPGFRRRGYGAALTSRAAHDGRAEGCTASYLEASDLGRPIYERLGYRTVTTHHSWLSPAP